MPVKIKGNEYVTVAERMELLRQSGKPFEMVESKAIALGERVAWQVSIMIDSRLFIGSAEAHLNAKSGSADATDPFACAETSAIGRALGLAGFGSIDAIASADEIVRTIGTSAQPIDRDEALRDLARPGPARAGKGLPAQPADEPPIENMQASKNRCRNRAYRLDIKTIAQYEQYCQAIIGKPAPETLTDINKLNADLEQREKQPNTA